MPWPHVAGAIRGGDGVPSAMVVAHTGNGRGAVREEEGTVTAAAGEWGGWEGGLAALRSWLRG